MNDRPIIRTRSVTVLSPWVSVVDREVVSGQGEVDHFHSIRQCDYVSVLAETPGEEIVLVRQYRPALEAYTLELPGGLREQNEDPMATAVRELAEETGYRAISALEFLGNLSPDTGRLENRLWCYRARNVEAIKGWQEESGVRRMLVAKREVIRMIRSSEMDNALHVAVLCLALLCDGVGYGSVK